jgi:hypothetical protein
MLLAILAGCSQDANNAVDPMATDLMPTHATEWIAIQGQSYEYGCPTYPCPVNDLVKSHIDMGRWFWLPDGLFGKPAIYLTVLQTPVQLRMKTVDPPPPPPFLKLDPGLTGPTSMLGVRMEPLGQLACMKVQLAIVSPDGRSWEFVSGQRELAYEGGGTQVVPLFRSDWDQLTAGMYGIYPGYGTPPYDATFSVKVRTSDMDEHVLDHAMACLDAEEPEPEDPWLTGPENWKGRLLPDMGLVCRDFETELISPDGGPWAFRDGQLLLEYLRWGPDLQAWVKMGSTTTYTLDPGDWDALLEGDYMIKPKMSSVAYHATFTATVGREVGVASVDRPVKHRMTCVGPDMWDMLYRPR